MKRTKPKENQQQLKTPTTMQTETTDTADKMTDGIYFIEETASRHTYTKLADDTASAPTATKYIGVKMGDRAIAVALEDLPGKNGGELQLLPRNHKSPATSEHYSWDAEKMVDRFNAFEDFDGKGNTARLKAAGCKIKLPEGEWIPSVGEIGLLMMNLSKVNKALELAGGKPLKRLSWSSTEYSANGAWVVYFSDGNTLGYSKSGSGAVRAVTAF